MTRRDCKADGLVATETWLPQGQAVDYLKSLTHVGQEVLLPNGANLFNQGSIDNAFYIVISGKVYVSTLSEDGHEAIFNIMGPGSMIGEAAALLQQPRYSQASAVEDTRLLRFEVAKIPDLVRQDPNFVLAMLYLFSIKQRQLVERLRQAVFDTPEKRIAQFLEQFRATHRETGDANQAVAVNLTQEQIGNLTALSRVTVARVLNRFKREGLIAVQGKKILLLPDFDRRRACAAADL